ncbi:unnamed protein product [Prorocentrum cordatum]|uniref:TIR domain-containing protein n=1 Tax=Prorocentrum cordatum TaxID=2364126 RepID=A0ABN9QUT8_9DINO|nr:unnamed protein product [Polarella glacialis]
MCISQSDPEQKKRGVLSIGGFLRRSDLMLMLCTPRYFSRMWCAFEMAAWMRLKNVGSIIFLPPSHAKFTGLFFSIVLLTHFCIYIGTWLPRVPTIPLALLVANCAPLPLTYFARQVMRELLSMPDLLREHDVSKTQCFCCSHRHVDPATGFALLCDREIVYEAIDGWYGITPASSQQLAAEAGGSPCGVPAVASRVGKERFNEEVQTKLSEALEIMVAKPTSYRSWLIVASPSIWWYLDQITAMVVDGPHDPYLVFKRGLRIFIVCFLLWPLNCAQVLREAKRFRRRGTGRCGELGLTLAAFVCAQGPCTVCNFVLVAVAEPSQSAVFEAVLIVLISARLAVLLYPARLRAAAFALARRRVTA